MREALEGLVGERVLITGAAGSVGTALFKALLGERQIDVLATDVETMDVRNRLVVETVVRAFAPTVVFHLAGAKHAPLGEEDPWEAAAINIMGTRNVLNSAQGARVVTASTCKACNPETAYGATKLIAERMTLNHGGSVARFYNVIETSGNVFEIWRNIPKGEPIPVNHCKRYFITIEQTVRLLLYSAILEPARYTIHRPRQWKVEDMARELYPARKKVVIGPRRGDRIEEPIWATNEHGSPVSVDGIIEIQSYHDKDYGKDNEWQLSLTA